MDIDTKFYVSSFGEKVDSDSMCYLSLVFIKMDIAGKNDKLE